MSRSPTVAAVSLAEGVAPPPDAHEAAKSASATRAGTVRKVRLRGITVAQSTWASSSDGPLPRNRGDACVHRSGLWQLRLPGRGGSGARGRADRQDVLATH